MNEKFSSRLREARGSMSQAEFCALINVKQGTYSTWELGKYEPPLEILTKIASVTQRTTDWLLGLPSPSPIHNETDNPLKEKTLQYAPIRCPECTKKDSEILRLNKIIDKLVSK